MARSRDGAVAIPFLVLVPATRQHADPLLTADGRKEPKLKRPAAGTSTLTESPPTVPSGYELGLALKNRAEFCQLVRDDIEAGLPFGTIMNRVLDVAPWACMCEPLASILITDLGPCDVEDLPRVAASQADRWKRSRGRPAGAVELGPKESFYEYLQEYRGDGRMTDTATHTLEQNGYDARAVKESRRRALKRQAKSGVQAYAFPFLDEAVALTPEGEPDASTCLAAWLAGEQIPRRLRALTGGAPLVTLLHPAASAPAS